jgi:hypothetical protein
MRTRTKWVVAGGAAALVITPVIAVYGSPTAGAGPEQRGLVIDAEAANRARADRVTPPTASPTPSATTKAKAKAKSTKPTAEPSGKKTVSAASPISPKSPKSPDTPG